MGAHYGISHAKPSRETGTDISQETYARQMCLDSRQSRGFPLPEDPRGSDTTPSAVGPVVLLLHHAAHV